MERLTITLIVLNQPVNPAYAQTTNPLCLHSVRVVSEQSIYLSHMRLFDNTCHAYFRFMPQSPMELPKLDRGARGNLVRSWQLFLVSQEIEMNISSRLGDGIFGARTRHRTQEYQSRNDLTATGFVDAETYVQAVQ